MIYKVTAELFDLVLKYFVGRGELLMLQGFGQTCNKESSLK